MYQFSTETRKALTVPSVTRNVAWPKYTYVDVKARSDAAVNGDLW
jgi:hypothetical protein